MAFEDLFSSIGSFFGGGSSGAPAAGGGGGATTAVAPEPQGGFDWGKLMMPILTGGAGMLASKLLGTNTSKLQKQAASGNKTALNVGEQMVKDAAAGKMTPAQQAAVDKMKTEQNARANQYFANLGIPVSTSMMESQNKVEQDALAFSQQLIDQSMNEGLKALSLGQTGTMEYLKTAAAQNQNISKIISDVAAEIGRVLTQPNKPGQGGGGQPSVPADWTDYGSWPETLPTDSSPIS